MTVLEVSGLSAGYDRRAVVHDLSLTVGEGEIVAMLGPNGAGKSTTLLALSGLVDVIDGTIELAGTDVTTVAPHRRARQGMAHVPEDRSLFPTMSTAEHLRLGGRGGEIDPAEVHRWFPALERLADRPVGLLSGGEQQMLAVARALMGSPKLLMVDELSLGLAPIVVGSLLDTLQRVASESGCGVLLVEQHVRMALEVADRAIVLQRGKVVVEGPAADLLADPNLLRESYLGA